MRTALRRVRWGLLAAGALGLAGPSLAQMPGGAADGPGQVRPEAVAADQIARLEAMQVELAWLADPVTFPYPLTARPAAGRLEVSGEVPGPAIRQLTLETARAQSTLPVTDLLKINPGLESRRPGASPELLQTEAAALIGQDLPWQAQWITVQAQADGRIVVSGSVASCDDRLAVSRLMRRVGGCACVVNHLEVGRVAADRTETRVPTAQHAAAPLSPLRQVKAEEPADATGSVTQAVAHGPAPLPAELLPRGEANPGPLVVMPPAPGASSVQKVAALTQPTESTAPSGKATRPTAKASPTGAGYVGTGVLIRQAENSPSGPAAKPAEPTHTPKPPATPAGGYVSTGVMIRPAEKAAAVPAQPSAPPGVLSRPPVALPAAPALDLAKVKRRVEAVCGRTARDVEVVPRPGNAVEIRFKVATAAEGDKLSTKVVMLPELVPYQVSFRMQVDR